MSGLDAALLDIVQLLLLLVLLITLMSRLQGLDELRRRLTRLESKIDAVMQNLGITWEPPAPGGSDTVISHLRAGRKIEAIKNYREETGAGLKEAKEAVEAIQERLHQGVAH